MKNPVEITLELSPTEVKLFAYLLKRRYHLQDIPNASLETGVREAVKEITDAEMVKIALEEMDKRWQR